MVLAQVRAAYGAGVNNFLKVAIGALLIVIPVASLLRPPAPGPQINMAASGKRTYGFGVVAIGFVAGVLVGVTSIGAGSVILMLLLAFYGLPPTVVVGTNIVHAMLLAGVTGLLQFRLGNVNATISCLCPDWICPRRAFGRLPDQLPSIHSLEADTVHTPGGRRRENALGISAARLTDDPHLGHVVRIDSPRVSITRSVPAGPSCLTDRGIALLCPT